MNRLLNVMGCLAILVCGITINAAADDAPSAAIKRPCCASGEPQSPTEEIAPSMCLVSCLYEDLYSAYWVVDCYELNCSNPSQQYAWTEPGLSGPQTCGGSPSCIPLAATRLIVPAMNKPLLAGKSYVDILNTRVKMSETQPDLSWDPKDALKDLGELKATFVKVKNIDGKYFAVRLSAGIGELNKIQFPAGTNPPKFRIPDRKILIGFETEMSEADIKDLAEAKPKQWARYKDCPTAFVLTVANSDYFVTTTVANSVKIVATEVKGATAKPAEVKPETK